MISQTMSRRRPAQGKVPILLSIITVAAESVQGAPTPNSVARMTCSATARKARTGSLGEPRPRALTDSEREGLPSPRSSHLKLFRKPVVCQHRLKIGSGPYFGSQGQGRNNAGSSHTPFRCARRTHPIWQCWACPGFVRAAPALSAATWVRLPSATVTCCDRPPTKVFHLHSDPSASRRNHHQSPHLVLGFIYLMQRSVLPS
jgi:hypothetical protein